MRALTLNTGGASPAPTETTEACSGDFLLFDEASYRVAGARADTQPILDAVGIELDFRGLFERIIGSHKFANAAITGPGSFNDYYPVKGPFLLANPC
jgi:hypothetical protein